MSDEITMAQINAKLDRLLLYMEMQLNGERLHQVAGYSWGRTSDGDPFVILYPANSRLRHKICRVYEDDFGKLPAFVDTAVIPDTAQEGNPDREQAIRQKIYRPTPAFVISTRDGKETQMGVEIRFSRTVEAPRPVTMAVSKPTPTATGATPPTSTPAGKGDIFEYKYGDGTAATEAARPHFDAYRRAHGEQSPASREALGEWCKAEGRIP